MKISIILFSSLMGLVLITEVSASENKVLTTALSHCTKISNGIERLACFDKLANKSLAPSNPVTVVEEKVAKSDKIRREEIKRINDFSKEVLKKENSDKSADSITAKIVKLKKSIRGQWIIYFENGQKWQQTDSAELRLSVDNNVRLEKGSFRAVYLYKEGVNRSIRVKRLK